MSADLLRNPHARSPKLYLLPTLAVTVVMAILAIMYLGGVLNPQKNLHDFPMGIVNLDQGTSIDAPGGAVSLYLGAQVQQGLLDNVPHDKVHLEQMSLPQAHEAADRGGIYGFIVISEDFSAQLLQLAHSSFSDVPVQQPTITVEQNSRAGAYAGNLAAAVASQALTQVNVKVGNMLTDQVNQMSNGAQLTGTAKLMLAQPVAVKSERYRSEIDGTGGGLSAFYYALLLVFAGFTGSLIIQSLSDSILGFIPMEVGPLYVHRPASGLSRLETLVVKWLIVALMAVVVSGVYVGIGKWLGMPIDHPWATYGYGVFAILATGIAAISILSMFGTVGLVVNLIAFIVLGLPTSGATIPVEAVPKSFEFMSHFEPLHSVYLAVRALLYFDGIGNAGLYEGLWKTGLGIVIGLILGVVTWLYDRKGFVRGRNGSEPEAQPALAEVDDGQQVEDLGRTVPRQVGSSRRRQPRHQL